MTKRTSILLITALLGGAACDLPETFEPGPDANRHVGIVEWTRSNVQTFADPAMGVITSPDTVTAGQPFQVTVTTVGPNGCWRAAGAEMAVQSSLASITPFDRVEGEVCTQALVSLPHTLQVQFNTPGTATLRVYGRRVVDGRVNEATDRTVEKTIHVR